MIMNGTDIVTVSKLLGHSNIEMTMRYSHPTTEGKMDAVNGTEMQIRGHDNDTLAKVDTILKAVSASNN